ncbi:hypothetical protein CJU89_3566 [Yarrowia sp. B02]|nr:hypothetical protein CJU89_3566 [Yarrowia sp. B02]
MSDHEIRQALLREAQLPSRPSLSRPSTTHRNKPNHQFLSRVVSRVDSHNGNLKRQERERASRKFEILDRFIKEELDCGDDENRDRHEREGYQETRRARVTRFDKKPEKLQEQPSSSSNVKFSSVVDKIVRHHKEQADARNKIYTLTSIYKEPQTDPALPISGLSGAEQVGMGYDEEEDYDRKSVTKRRKKRRRSVRRYSDESDEEPRDRRRDDRRSRSRDSERRSRERSPERERSDRRSRDRSPERRGSRRSRSPGRT